MTSSRIFTHWLWILITLTKYKLMAKRLSLVSWKPIGTFFLRRRLRSSFPQFLFKFNLNWYEHGLYLFNEMYDKIGIFRIRTQRNRKIGMSENILMTRMTRSPKTGTSRNIFLIRTPKNRKTGMMKWMESGNHQWLIIRNIKENGSRSRRKILHTRWNYNFIIVFLFDFQML